MATKRMSKPRTQRNQKRPQRSGDKQGNPAVKAWLKNVIVPAMVQQYVESNPGQIHKKRTPEHQGWGTVVSTVKI
jgi:hypothetical protein